MNKLKLPMALENTETIKYDRIIPTMRKFLKNIVNEMLPVRPPGSNWIPANALKRLLPNVTLTSWYTIQLQITNFFNMLTFYHLLPEDNYKTQKAFNKYQYISATILVIFCAIWRPILFLLSIFWYNHHHNVLDTKINVQHITFIRNRKKEKNPECFMLQFACY